VRLRDNEIPMSTGVHLPDDDYMATEMAIPPSMNVLFTAQVLRLSKLFSSRNAARIMVKIKDELGGRLTDRGADRLRVAATGRGRVSLRPAGLSAAASRALLFGGVSAPRHTPSRRRHA
jgi:hypothetical protein